MYPPIPYAFAAASLVPSAEDAIPLHRNEPESVRSVHVTPESVEVKIELPRVAANFVPSEDEAIRCQAPAPADARGTKMLPVASVSTPLPHPVNEQFESQPSPLTRLPSSQVSPGSWIPSPHVA